MAWDLEIVSGGKKVELNPFSESIVLNTLKGLLASLKGVDLESEIRVIVRPKTDR